MLTRFGSAKSVGLKRQWAGSIPAPVPPASLLERPLFFFLRPSDGGGTRTNIVASRWVGALVESSGSLLPVGDPGTILVVGKLRRRLGPLVVWSLVAACGGKSSKREGQPVAEGGRSAHAGDAGLAGSTDVGIGGVAGSRSGAPGGELGGDGSDARGGSDSVGGSDAAGGTDAVGGSDSVEVPRLPPIPIVDERPSDYLTPDAPTPWEDVEEDRLVTLPDERWIFDGPLLSADGRVVAVTSRPNYSEPSFIGRWVVDAGSPDVGLEAIPGTGSASVQAISADGSVVLGVDEEGDFIWREGTMTRLPFDRGPWDCVPRLSGDGQSVVGCLERASVLIRGEKKTVIDDLPPGTNCSMPLAINHGGSAVVGVAYHWTPDYELSRNMQPLYWTARDGTRVIPLPSNVGDARAIAVSDDGKRVVLAAVVFSASGPRTSVILRWTESSGVELVVQSNQAVVNPDASVVVGVDRSALYRWTEEAGLSWFTAWEDGAVFTDRVRLGEVTQVSADGRRLVGLEDRGDFSPAPPLFWDIEWGIVSDDEAVPGLAELGWGWLESSSISHDGRFVAGIAYREERSRLFRLDLAE